MEKRKRGRPKVDTHITEGYYDNRSKELNYKYMFEGTGVLMDAAEDFIQFLISHSSKPLSKR